MEILKPMAQGMHVPFISYSANISIMQVLLCIHETVSVATIYHKYSVLDQQTDMACTD